MFIWNLVIFAEIKYYGKDKNEAGGRQIVDQDNRQLPCRMPVRYSAVRSDRLCRYHACQGHIAYDCFAVCLEDRNRSHIRNSVGLWSDFNVKETDELTPGVTSYPRIWAA